MNVQRDHAVLAGLLIAVGVLFLLANLDLLIVDVGDLVTTWWPSLLILFGLWRLLADRGANPIGPAFLIGLGIILQVIMVGWAGWGILWPLALVAIGVLILVQGGLLRRRPVQSATGDDTVDLFTMFGGIERRITSQHFRGGKVTAIFGGIELDLREAQLADDASLNATVLFGGLEMRVPESWNVQVNGSPLFGAIEDPKGRGSFQNQRSSPILRLYASVTFGGLEIKR